MCGHDDVVIQQIGIKSFETSIRCKKSTTLF